MAEVENKEKSLFIPDKMVFSLALSDSDTKKVISIKRKHSYKFLKNFKTKPLPFSKFMARRKFVNELELADAFYFNNHLKNAKSNSGTFIGAIGIEIPIGHRYDERGFAIYRIRVHINGVDLLKKYLINSGRYVSVVLNRENEIDLNQIGEDVILDAEKIIANEVVKTLEIAKQFAVDAIEGMVGQKIHKNGIVVRFSELQICRICSSNPGLENLFSFGKSICGRLKDCEGSFENMDKFRIVKGRLLKGDQIVCYEINPASYKIEERFTHWYAFNRIIKNIRILNETDMAEKLQLLQNYFKRNVSNIQEYLRIFEEKGTHSKISNGEVFRIYNSIFSRKDDLCEQLCLEIEEEVLKLKKPITSEPRNRKYIAKLKKLGLVERGEAWGCWVLTLKGVNFFSSPFYQKMEGVRKRNFGKGF